MLSGCSRLRSELELARPGNHPSPYKVSIQGLVGSTQHLATRVFNRRWQLDSHLREGGSSATRTG
eukprot:2829502-Pyramimonas_sp.AAC.1